MTVRGRRDERPARLATLLLLGCGHEQIEALRIARRRRRTTRRTRPVGRGALTPCVPARRSQGLPGRREGRPTASSSMQLNSRSKPPPSPKTTRAASGARARRVDVTRKRRRRTRRAPGGAGRPPSLFRSAVAVRLVVRARILRAFAFVGDRAVVHPRPGVPTGPVLGVGARRRERVKRRLQILRGANARRTRTRRSRFRTRLLAGAFPNAKPPSSGATSRSPPAPRAAPNGSPGTHHLTGSSVDFPLGGGRARGSRPSAPLTSTASRGLAASELNRAGSQTRTASPGASVCTYAARGSPTTTRPTRPGDGAVLLASRRGNSARRRASDAAAFLPSRHLGGSADGAEPRDVGRREHRQPRGGRLSSSSRSPAASARGARAVRSSGPRRWPASEGTRRS